VSGERLESDIESGERLESSQGAYGQPDRKILEVELQAGRKASSRSKRN
jgi:hypothetical protein